MQDALEVALGDPAHRDQDIAEAPAVLPLPAEGLGGILRGDETVRDQQFAKKHAIPLR
ncbi:hypothetical protein GCM10010964_07560 [Caldovatus sediminis]|uniref:Uncharacterized protein n=1 Tax=Caldovatus sediminis TaxID=2041189 RepID=A0A8J3EA37_9PROT|nr:hypothetical protein GCM10010964_07560 [Caldovatus sediminis]